MKILRYSIPAILTGLLVTGVVYAASVFNSNQVGTSPSNGKVLQTNGTISTWVATSTLGIGATITFPISYASSTATTTNTLWVDGNRGDTYTANGSIVFPYKTFSAALALSGASAYVYNLSPATYVDGAPDTVSNVPVYISGNESTYVPASGVTFQNAYDIYDLTISGNVVENHCSLSTIHQMNNGVLSGSFSGCGNDTFSGMAVVSQTLPLTVLQTSLDNIVGSLIQSPILNYGVLNLNDDQLQASTTGYLLTSTTSGQTIINGATIINQASNAGGLNVANGATSSPNIISNFGLVIATTGPGSLIKAGNAATVICNGSNFWDKNGTFVPSEITGTNWQPCYDESRVVLSTLVVPGTLTASSTVLLNATSSSFAVTNLTSGNCVQAAAGGYLTTTGAGCGGSASASGTAGSIQFAGAGNTFNSDTNNFFWDNTNKRLGIGTSTPTQSLDVAGNFQLSTSTLTSGNIYQDGKIIYTSIGSQGTDKRNMFFGSGGPLWTINNRTGFGNTAMGGDTLNSLNSGLVGNYNTAFGVSALQDVQTGSNNIGIGVQAGWEINTSSDNIALGSFAMSLYSGSGGNNICIGSYCLDAHSHTLSGNTVTGYRALNFQPQADGTNNNTAYGYEVGYQAGSTGAALINDTLFGYQAGYNASSSSIMLGYQAGYNEIQPNKLYIANNSVWPIIYGDLANGYLNINATNTAANLYVQGTSTTPTANILVIASSSTTSYLTVGANGKTSLNSLLLQNIASGTQCLHADSSGNVTGTGSDCGSGGNSGNAAWTIGNGVIYNATSTDNVGIGSSTVLAALDIVRSIISSSSTNATTSAGAALRIDNPGITTTGTVASISFGTDDTNGINLISFNDTNNTRFGGSATGTIMRIFPGDVLALGANAGGAILSNGIGSNYANHHFHEYAITALGNAAYQGQGTNCAVPFDPTQSFETTVIGDNALYNAVWSSTVVAIGNGAGGAQCFPSSSVIIGTDAMNNNTGGLSGGFSDDVIVGTAAAYQNVGSHNTILGDRALNSLSTVTENNDFGSYNTIVGNNAGRSLNSPNITSLGSNILFGYSTGYKLDRATNDILIGNNIDLTGTTTSNTLDIGNLIYATPINQFNDYGGNPKSTSTISLGLVGIGTSTPFAKLTVVGNSSSSEVSSPEFVVASSSGQINLQVASGGKTSLNSLLLQNIASGTQCLHADSSGNVTGTGSDCGSGGGGTSVGWASTTNAIYTNFGYKVGINSSTPFANLTIEGSSTAPSLNLLDLASSTNSILLSVNQAGQVLANSNINQVTYGFLNSGSTSGLEPSGNPVTGFAAIANGTNVSAFTSTSIQNTVPIEGFGGSNSAPNYSFLTDTGTGMYATNAGDHVLRFATNGNQIFTMNALGNIGINSTTPAATFAIQGYAGSATSTLLVASSSGANYLNIAANGSTTIGSLSLPGFVKSTSAGLLYNDNTSYQTALTNPDTGTGASPQIAVWNGTTALTGFSGFLWDNSNTRLVVGGTINATSSNITNATSTNITGTNVYLTGSTASFLATDPNGKIISTTSPQMQISLTTNGSSGAATFSNNVLNIPQYSGGGTNYWSTVTNGIFNNSGYLVGVGSNTPYSNLTVQGSSTAPTIPILTVASSSGSSYLQITSKGQILMGAGLNNCTTPDIRFTTNNNGFRDQASNNLTICVNGNSLLQLLDPQLLVRNGSTISAPEYSFGTDTGTGMHDSSNVLTFSTNAVGRITIGATGLVGIASATPGSSLVIQGTGGQSVPLLTVASSTNASYLTVTNLGNVGLGTTTPLANLVIQGSSAQTADLFNVASSSGAVLFKIASSGDASLLAVSTSSQALLMKNPSGNSVLQVDEGAATSGLTLGTTTTSSLYTSARLEIVGDTSSTTLPFLDIASSTSNTVFRVTNSATTTVQIDAAGASKGTCLKIRDAGGTAFTYCTTKAGTLSCSTNSCE